MGAQRWTDWPEVTLPGIVLGLRIKLGPVNTTVCAFAANINHVASQQKMPRPFSLRSPFSESWFEKKEEEKKLTSVFKVLRSEIRIQDKPWFADAADRLFKGFYFEEVTFVPKWLKWTENGRLSLPKETGHCLSEAVTWNQTLTAGIWVPFFLPRGDFVSKNTKD